MAMLNENSCLYIIASNLLKLPSDSFLMCIKTSHQFDNWLLMRGRTSLESAHWWSIVTGSNDFLHGLEKEGLINQWERIRIIKTVNFYQRFWELTREVEPFLSEQWGEDYPSKSAGEDSAAWLFMDILRQFINGEYKKCLQSYFKCSAKDIELIAANSQEKVKRPQQKKAADAIAKRLTQNHGKIIDFLEYCGYVGSKDEAVNMRIRAWKQASDELGEFMEAAAKRKKATSKSNRFRSYTWEKGQLKLGSDKGGVYS